MKLQISFDTTDLDKSLEIASELIPFVDILEIGTLLIYSHGTKAIQEFSKKFPDKTILADTKIIDRAKEATSLMIKNGADWITVMAGTSKNVIHGACTSAHYENKKVMLDLIDAFSMGQSALEAKTLGVDALLFHHAYDEQQPMTFLENWELVKGNTNIPIFISTQIKRENIHEILKLKPDGIIIGKAILENDKPQQEAEFFYNLIKSQ